MGGFLTFARNLSSLLGFGSLADAQVAGPAGHGSALCLWTVTSPDFRRNFCEHKELGCSPGVVLFAGRDSAPWPPAPGPCTFSNRNEDICMIRVGSGNDKCHGKSGPGRAGSQLKPLSLHKAAAAPSWTRLLASNVMRWEGGYYRRCACSKGGEGWQAHSLAPSSHVVPRGTSCQLLCQGPLLLGLLVLPFETPSCSMRNGKCLQTRRLVCMLYAPKKGWGESKGCIFTILTSFGPR